VRLLDWHQIAQANPKWLYRDKVHLNKEGQRMYADLIMQTIGN
jgi:lysophospholipase L1-like esterase